MFHVRTHCPGVLVAELDFDGPTARRSPDRVRGMHVQAQEAERREIALAQQAVFRVLLRCSLLRDSGLAPKQEKKEERSNADATWQRVQPLEHSRTEHADFPR